MSIKNVISWGTLLKLGTLPAPYQTWKLYYAILSNFHNTIQAKSNNINYKNVPLFPPSIVFILILI